MPELIVGERSCAVTGILFDKDGTLLDFVSMWGCWSEHVLNGFKQRLAALGLQLSMTGGHSSLWGTFHSKDGTIVDYDRNGPLAMGTMEELHALLIWQGYRSGLSWSAAKELVHACSAAANEELKRVRPARPITGVEALLKACRAQRIPLGVVTADETAAAEMHLDWLGFRHYFAAVVGTDQVERGKPFPDMMELVCRKLSIECREAAVIGDTNGDMRMGKAAGAKLCIALGRPDSPAAGSNHFPDADLIIDSYREIRLGGIQGED
ncbi:HAD family hydrolase [Paenibacillus sp. sptzw28]|uniref:HAD family hydrolase n=1 Tax=Paenibacillus sp. sptzw28 TaxID=715179 RepID=UPI001C6ECAC1|nr:HAD family hydrolase [Paenibacillus sp. sptzw28]QYR20969.1 HAD family hydrolase [Paenibacillus sp. sptzw28]